MILSAEALQDLKWWSIQINSGIKAPIRQKSIQATLTTDASGIGWGQNTMVSLQGDIGPLKKNSPCPTLTIWNYMQFFFDYKVFMLSCVINM